jgi:lipopolysaccharide/colanic/teichoic acid biosynthesis glycosyltransferase
VLIVGMTDLTELYLRSVSEFAQGCLTVVGILSREREMHGRFVRRYKILGGPEKVQNVLSELHLHGVAVERIVVMQPFEQLSEDAQKALLAVERTSAIGVDWLVEKLGLRGGSASGARDIPKAATNNGEDEQPPHLEANGVLSRGRYHYVKRAIDGTAVICVTFALAPVLALVALLVAIDVGYPLVFWQQRPGRYGRPFKLFKFRTMRAAHDAKGNRIPDQLRSSTIGDFLRRCRLDELPQLYNILLGEMSFVGPRPLLPVDQPRWQKSRLLVRPGLTGWAQINGGRDISPEDKAALDIWYIMNASLWLDIVILLRTLVTMVLGERLNRSAVRAAHATLERMRTRLDARSLPTLLPDAGLVAPTRRARGAL